MSKNSNGRYVDTSIIDPLGSDDIALPMNVVRRAMRCAMRWGEVRAHIAMWKERPAEQRQAEQRQATAILDGAMPDPRETCDRALNPLPPPEETRVKTCLVPVRTKRVGHGGSFAGWIDLGQCTGIDERKGWDRPDVFEWEELFRTPDVRFFVHIWTQLNEHPYETVEKYAVFITELAAVEWYADDPGSPPECMRPLVERYIFTLTPADRPEPVTVALSNSGRATEGNGITATNGHVPRAPISRLELAAVKCGEDQENAEKLRSAMRDLGATDERSAAQEGKLRLATQLTEREYRKAIRILKTEKAVRTKTRVGAWLVC
jgi:hypothetical protein